MSGEIPAVVPGVARGGPGCAAVAGGSATTVDAAVAVLQAGGNAVDAALAAGFASAVGEPTLSSLGGGGFLLVADPGQDPVVLDFFVDVPGLGGTPREPHIDTLRVTYGSDAQQTFHVGWGTVATPGCFTGYLDAHRRWGRLPLADICAPAIRAAREGVHLDAVQIEFIEVIGAILQLTSASDELYAAPRAGQPFRNPAYADLLEGIARGDIADPADPPFGEALVEAMSANGGLVTMQDLRSYAPVLRRPIRARRGSGDTAADIWTNPPPSFGGSIILEALGCTPPHRDAASLWPALVAEIRAATRRRRQHDLDAGRTQVIRGTTHVSIVDADGRVAALSVSNGSGSGTVVQGVSLNNMLGEEDLNPAGLHALPPGTRMGSMMAPTMVRTAEGAILAAGTGGSERIRSAISGVIARCLDLGYAVPDAIAAPRVHPGEGLLDLEPGLAEEVLWALRAEPVREWAQPDLYFGGVHAVRRAPDGSVEAIGDVRRGGAVAVI
ncbi:MAG: gamma-glutamyltransferase [Candidatus Nanopelagicales bacterium]